LFVVQGLHLFFTRNSEYNFIALINGIYASTILALFLNFYFKKYFKKGQTSKERFAAHEKRDLGEIVEANNCGDFRKRILQKSSTDIKERAP